MTTDLDVYRSAKLFIEQHGDEAAIQAAYQPDAMLNRGDPDGAAVWRLTIMGGSKRNSLLTAPIEGRGP